MGDERKRDPSIERALKREGAGWRKEAPPSGSTCVDAETLALWAEGALPTIEALAVEMHVTDCARCQEVVATFALTEPEIAATPLPERAPWLQRWWLPIAGGLVAATLLIVAVTRRNDIAAPQPEAQTTKVEAPATPAASQTELKAVAAPPTVIKQQPPASAPQQKRAAAAKAITPPEPADLTAAAPMTVAAPPPPVLAPAPIAPPAAAPQQSSLAARPLAGGMVGGVVAGTITGVANTAQSGGATELRAERAMPAGSGAPMPPAVIEFAPLTSVAAESRRGGGGGTPRMAALSLVAPGPTTRWRITTASPKVERSTDSGATWVTVDVGSDPIAITNGIAPSRLTCWLIGRAGGVLRSTDGATFTRVTFPDAVDLVSIIATDAMHATITAAGGRQFTTDDGGNTWK